VEELTDEVHAEIQKLCADGDKHAESQQFAEALKAYWSAWDLIPEPKTEWDAATWVLAAIGDANFLGQDYVAGRDNLSNAMSCPRGLGNPFIHLRLGQCQLELGELDRAADELMRAYMGAGAEIFKDQDPKYIKFLQTRAQGIESPKKKWQFWK
jgi:tetratricopeptide (TPR) repeat protein